jgi:hypothetical protein
VVNGCKKSTVFTCAKTQLSPILSPTLTWSSSFLSDERVFDAAAIVVMNSNGRMINITGLPVDLISSQVSYWPCPPGKAKKKWLAKYRITKLQQFEFRRQDKHWQ